MAHHVPICTSICYWRLPEADNTSCLWPSSIETVFDLVKQVQVKRNTVCKIMDSRYDLRVGGRSRCQSQAAVVYVYLVSGGHYPQLRLDYI